MIRVKTKYSLWWVVTTVFFATIIWVIMTTMHQCGGSFMRIRKGFPNNLFDVMTTILIDYKHLYHLYHYRTINRSNYGRII